MTWTNILKFIVLNIIGLPILYLVGTMLSGNFDISTWHFIVKVVVTVYFTIYECIIGSLTFH